MNLKSLKSVAEIWIQCAKSDMVSTMFMLKQPRALENKKKYKENQKKKAKGEHTLWKSLHGGYSDTRAGHLLVCVCGTVLNL